MNLLDLLVTIGVKDEASDAIDGVSQNLVGKLASAAATAAKALAGTFVVKKVVDFGKASFDAYANFEQMAGGIKQLMGQGEQSFEEYQKSMAYTGMSVDELKEKYDSLGRAEQKMFDNASKAWRNAQMDTSKYLEVGTMFTGRLQRELGDSEKAADQINTLITSLADNYNRYGTSVESQITAAQSIARGSYRMLDTFTSNQYSEGKESFQQFMKDAEDYAKEMSKLSFDEYAASMAKTGLSADDLKQRYDKLKESTDLSEDSFSDIITALSLVQEKSGTAGVSQSEALKTLEGSMNATKAAWQNLVLEFGKPDADIGARLADMFTAIMGENGEGGVLRNVTKEVGTIAKNMMKAVSDVISVAFGYIRDNGPKMLESAMLSVGDALERAWDKLLDFHTDFNLVDAVFGEGGVMETAGKVGEWFQGIGQVIAENWPYIQDQLSMLWDEVVATAETYGPQIMEVAGRLVSMARDAIVEHGPEILAKVGEVIGKVIAHIGTFVADMVSKGREFIGGLITGSSEEGQKLHKWFADFFPSGLLKGLGDFATFLLDAGRALINGLLDGIGEVAPDVEDAIRTAFDAVISFFETMGEFIQDPIGTIQRGFDALMGSSDDAASGVEKSMGKVEGSVDKSMTNASASVQKYNGTKLKDKSATAKVTGNAENGSAKKAVNDTNTAVQKLKDKSVSVDVKGNVTSGVAGGSIKTALDLIGKMKDKSVTLTTHNVTRNTKITETKQARGGIRRHARGDIFVANNPGYGVDVNSVKDIMGEAGPEAIVPLTSHYGKDFAQMMGKEAAKVMGGSGTTVNIYMTYNAGEDATQMVSDIAAGLQLVL